MTRLRNSHRSEQRPNYEHPPGTQVVLHELLDESKLIWLVEVALPNPDLVGGAEFEVLELPASAIDFKGETVQELPATDAEALRTAEKWLGDDIAVQTSDRLAPRKLEHAA